MRGRLPRPISMLWFFAAFFFVNGTARGAGLPNPLPTDLAPWLPWVQADNPTTVCPHNGVEPACIWPGVLSLDLNESGGTFLLQATMDVPGELPLPGGPGAWPLSVEVGNQRAIVVGRGERPVALLPAGSHQVKGKFVWERRPQSLPVPPTLGILRLVLDKVPLKSPPLSSEGELRLGNGEEGPTEESRVEIDVARQILDGVPPQVVTWIAVRASGNPRELQLPGALLAGTRPVSVEGDLPARLDAKGNLAVQVRAGSASVKVLSLLEGHLVNLSPPQVDIPGWPSAEFWVVDTNDSLRAVEISGVPGIDSQRATLPEDWKGKATWMVAPGSTLEFKELRRGRPQVEPDSVNLSRDLWLDPDGQGWTIRDTFRGTLTRSWRLDMRAPAMLGHARANGSDQVVTLSPEGRSGVELRNANLVMVAEGRIEEEIVALPAVGWEVRAESLAATLHLPPGYALLATWGVDEENSSWIAQFDLLSILSLIVVCALGFWAEGVLGAFLCGVAALSVGGLELGSMVVVGALAGLRSIEKRNPSTQRLRQFGGAVALLFAFGMVVGQVKLAALPNVPPSDQWNSYLPVHVDWEQGDMLLNPDAGVGAEAKEVGAAEVGWDGYGGSSMGSRKGGVSKDVYSNMSLQIDPNAVVQTGPGLPTWSGQTHQLGWSGPVEASHVMRILLLSPGMALVWTLARAAAFVGFVLLASGAVREAWWRSGRPLFAMLLLGLTWTATPARAEPSEAILKELKQKVEQGLACRPDCLEVSTLTFKVLGGAKGESLSIVAEVHAEESLSFALPGPVGAWVPNQVLIGDSPTASLSRREDGFLHVRLPKGVHRVTANGPLPESGGVTLQLGQSAQRVVLDAKGWQLAGVRADGTSDRNLQLVRLEGSQSGGNQLASADNLHPWIVVRRFLDLGVPWRVRTRVERQGPASAPIALRVPILTGESVTVDGFTVEAGAVLVTLDQGREFVEWTGTLPSEEFLRLQAPAGVPWTEEWALSCSPIFSCAIVDEGDSAVPAPFAHVHDGRWTPQWKPWPGETLAVAVGRPAATAGQTLTIDSATLTSTLRPRGAAHNLELVIRSAQGGQHRIGLPEGAALRSASVKGQSVPVQAREGFVPIPLQPGLQQVSLSWEEADSNPLLFAASNVDFGAPVANLTVRLNGLGERWVLGAKGPGWGPAVLLWPRLLLWGLASFLGFHVLRVRRAWRMPVSGAVFVVLTLGLVVGSAPSLFVATTLLLSLLREAIDRGRLGPGGGILALPLLFLVLGTVGVGLLVGLVGTPDVGIQGMLSNSDQLSWYLQGAPSAGPRPVAATLPILSLRVFVLGWGLLLLWASLRVFPFCFKLISEGGRKTPPPPSASGSSPTGGPPSPEQASDPTSKPSVVVDPPLTPGTGPSSSGVASGPRPTQGLPNGQVQAEGHSLAPKQAIGGSNDTGRGPESNKQSFTPMVQPSPTPRLDRPIQGASSTPASAFPSPMAPPREVSSKPSSRSHAGELSLSFTDQPPGSVDTVPLGPVHSPIRKGVETAENAPLNSVVEDPATERPTPLPFSTQSLILLSAGSPEGVLVPPELPASLLGPEPEPEDDFPTAPPETGTVALADINNPPVLTQPEPESGSSDPEKTSDNTEELELARLLGGEPQVPE